ncbi:MAG: hypothetical protein ACLFP9_01465 [Desulfonatronovibrio sp.]
MWKKFILLAVALCFIAGCSSMRQEPEEDTVYEPVEQVPEDEAANQKYYDFDDIPVPNEMKINPKGSILFESQDLRSGMLSFSGRVDSESLFDYFQATMPDEGWRLISYIKYGTYILTFDKPEKLCIVRIIEKSFSSELQMWISPKLSGSE